MSTNDDMDVKIDDDVQDDDVQDDDVQDDDVQDDDVQDDDVQDDDVQDDDVQDDDDTNVDKNMDEELLLEDDDEKEANNETEAAVSETEGTELDDEAVGNDDTHDVSQNGVVERAKSREGRKRSRSRSRERKDKRDDKRDDKREDKRDDKRDDRRQRRKRYFNAARIPDIMASNVKKQRNEVWKKTVMMGPLLWEDIEDPIVSNMIHDCCTCSLIFRKKPNESTDCHLELRYINHGDAANCCDKLERPVKTRSGHTIRRRTRMPLESQLQEWDQTMFSRMYMGNRVFLYVDNIPPTAMKEDVFATFPSCSYITYSLKADLLTGYSVMEYRSEDDIEDDLSDAPKMLHGNVLNTFQLTRSTQFHDRGRPVAMRNREMMGEYEGDRYGGYTPQDDQGESYNRDRGDRGNYERGHQERGGYDHGSPRGGGSNRRGYNRGGYNRDGGNYNRDSGNYHREGGGYNRGGDDSDRGSGFGQGSSDSRALGSLESMLLQEIGRKVMMQGSMGMMDQQDQGRQSSRYQSYNSRRW